MSDKDTGGPAFPVGTAFQGMTLRDYFAAKAMQGLLAGKLTITELSAIADDCYAMADAMLEAREQ